MKKWFIAIVALLLVAFLSGFLLPARQSVRVAVPLDKSYAGMVRFLGQPENWRSWWPGETERKPDGSLHLKEGDHWLVLFKTYDNLFRFDRISSSAHAESLLQFSEDTTGKLLLEWKASLTATANPIARWKIFRKSAELKKSFEDRIAALTRFLADEKNIYGFDIRLENVQIEYLVSTSRTLSHPPSTDEVYQLVQAIQDHLAKKQTEAIESPMLNITSSSPDTFRVQVGIPIASKLPDEPPFYTKWMLKGGHILTTEVTGGPGRIQEAQRQMEFFIFDRHHTSIAIPFQSMITNRQQVTDTSKWKTKLFYPVI